jgi:hypothetical protein
MQYNKHIDSNKAGAKMTKPNIPQILGVFDQLMEQHVNYLINTSYRKYATARDNLIDQFVSATGVDADVFTDHMACKLAKELYKNG